MDLNKFKIWFLINYEHLGFNISEFYQDPEDLKVYFGILYKDKQTNIRRINLERIMDLTVGDTEFRKFIFDCLLKQNGYRLDIDFTPLKQIKEFKL